MSFQCLTVKKIFLYKCKFNFDIYFYHIRDNNKEWSYYVFSNYFYFNEIVSFCQINFPINIHKNLCFPRRMDFSICIPLVQLALSGQTLFFFPRLDFIIKFLMWRQFSANINDGHKSLPFFVPFQVLFRSSMFYVKK